MATNNTDTSELGQAIQEITEKATLLIREEIELAKTEVIEKVTKLLKGAVVGIIAGIFAVFGLIYFLTSMAWLIWELLEGGDVNSPWLGFLIVAVLLWIFGAHRRLPRRALRQARRAADAADGDRGGQADQGDRHQRPSGDAAGPARGSAYLMAQTRTPAEIRQSIEANRAQLGVAVERLRGEVVKATDWRSQFQRHKKEVLIGAAVAGFVVGGGIAAMTGLLTGRRKSREYDW